MYLALSWPTRLQWALAVDTWVLPSFLHPLFGYHLLPLCLLQGRSDSVSEKAPIPAFGGVVHYSDCHRPAAHQTSYLSQCPDLATALPASSPRHPASPSQSLVQASFLQARLLLTTQFAMCLGHLSSCFVCRGKSWVRGDLGTGDSETGEAERVVRWGAEAGSRAVPGKGQCCILEVAGTTNEFSGRGGSIFPEAKMCTSSKLP